METKILPQAFVVTNQNAADKWQANGVQSPENDVYKVCCEVLKAALNGNPQAAFALAESYRKSDDARRAFRWYRQAAKQGVVEAMKRVVVAYSKGYGVTADADKAYYWALRVSVLAADSEVVTEEATEMLLRKTA